MSAGWLSESVPRGVNVPEESMAALGAADILKEQVIETMERRASFEIRCGDAPLFTDPLNPAAPAPEQLPLEAS